MFTCNSKSDHGLCHVQVSCMAPCMMARSSDVVCLPRPRGPSLYDGGRLRPVPALVREWSTPPPVRPGDRRPIQRTEIEGGSGKIRVLLYHSQPERTADGRRVVGTMKKRKTCLLECVKIYSGAAAYSVVVFVVVQSGWAGRGRQPLPCAPLRARK